MVFIILFLCHDLAALEIVKIIATNTILEACYKPNHFNSKVCLCYIFLYLNISIIQFIPKENFYTYYVPVADDTQITKIPTLKYITT